MAEAQPPSQSGRIHGIVSAAGILRVALLVAVLPVLGFFGAYHWVLDLFNHFQAQYFGLILLAVVLLAVWGKWRHFIVAVLLLLVPGTRLAPLYPPADANASSQALRVATFNVLGSNTRHADVAAWIQRANPDCIYLAESNEKWRAGLVALATSHPHSVDVFIEGNFGFSFRSKYPIVRKEIPYLGALELPLLEAVVAMPIDHILTRGFHGTLRRETGPALGSDHRPVIAELAW